MEIKQLSARQKFQLKFNLSMTVYVIRVKFESFHGLN